MAESAGYEKSQNLLFSKTSVSNRYFLWHAERERKFICRNDKKKDFTALLIAALAVTLPS